MTDLWVLVPVDDFIDRQVEKTASLFELAARLGAEATGLDDLPTQHLVQFARHLGLSFQIADDLRDLVGPDDLGRAPGTDLRTGVYTLPMLLAAAENTDHGARLRAAVTDLRQRRNAIEAERCRRILMEGTALAKSHEIFAEHFRKALAILEKPDLADLRRLLYAYAERIRSLAGRKLGTHEVSTSNECTL